MAKSFKDVLQDSPRTGLGIPVKTKNPLSRTNTPPAEPPFGFKFRPMFSPKLGPTFTQKKRFDWMKENDFFERLFFI